ncbi:MAG: alpha/beta hydrolase fold domain-containing protein [Alphaproteobacteria bacterium]|nr:alpha/beta hydrolase fold domain-containing protein [Alphaproteobacteria bacterium]
MRRKPSFTGLLAALLFPFFLAGCSGLQALDLVVPHTGYSLKSDIAYGRGPRQKLDVYVPAQPDASRAVVVFFYGGSWQDGEKDLYRFAGQAFAEKGFVAVLADYRLYPDVYFPAFMEDCAGALRWTRRHIAQYGGDPANIFVAGHSAGAYNAVMLALDTRYLQDAGESPADIRGVIGLSGPYDFLPFDEEPIRALFSKAPAARTQPVNFVRRGAPPMLLAWGDEDTRVKRRNIASLSRKLRAAGDAVEVHIYKGLDHPDTALALASGFRDRAPELRDIVNFIHRNARRTREKAAR